MKPKKPKRPPLPESYTLPDGRRREDAPDCWPFGTLTEAQVRERRQMERAMKDGELAKYPHGLK